MYRPGGRYSKSRVMLTDLIPEGSETLDLLERRDIQKQSKLMAAIDQVNQMMGRLTSSTQFRHPAVVGGRLRDAALPHTWRDAKKSNQRLS